MKQKVLKCLAFLVPVLLCAAVILWIGFGNQNNLSDSWSVTAEDTSDTEEDGPVEGQVPDSDPAEVVDGFVLVSGGTFAMGSPENEAWRGGDERQHTVTVSDFYISPYEVTQAEYEALAGANPSSFAGERLPVDSVSWLDAVTYCNLLSGQSGLTPAYQIVLLTIYSGFK